ncbi:MAG: Minf_1886 family protein [Planctomycetota bacterium]
MSSDAEGSDGFAYSLAKIARSDGRYDPQAFQFLFEALSYTQGLFEKNRDSETEEGRHVTGQELCEGVRRFAIEQFGYMAKAVFEEWGVFRTDDFGEMVYLLIQHQLMARRDSDSIDDFHNVYDFASAFDDVFVPEKTKRDRASRRT